jgi:hypothetical protein
MCTLNGAKFCEATQFLVKTSNLEGFKCQGLLLSAKNTGFSFDNLVMHAQLAHQT